MVKGIGESQSLVMPKRKRRIVVRFRDNRQGWELDYLDHSGRRRRPVFATEQAALDEAARVSRELAQGAPSVDDPDTTLATYADRWLAGGGGEIEPKTLASYRQLLTLHVLPVLGSLKVRDIRRRHVKGLLMSKRAGRLQREKGKGSEHANSGYSKNTVRLIKAALSSVLTDAIDDGYLETTNPAYSAGRKRRTVSAPGEVRPLSWEERDVLLTSAAPDRRHHALLSVLAKAGLRPGEAMALKAVDLDFRSLSVLVERAVTDGGRVKGTKTHETRIVDLTPDLAAALKRHLAWVKAESLRSGSGDLEWLFPTQEGTPMDKDHLGGIFRRLLKRAGLPHHRVYDLRHTYASLLLADGAPLTYVSAQLGHANPTTTLRHYARWMPKKGKRWVNVLDKTAGRPFVEPKSGASEQEG